jgi:hypothetical protein
MANLFELDLKRRVLWLLLTFLCMGSFAGAQTDTSSRASSLPLLAAGRYLGTTFYSSGRVPEDQATWGAIEEAVTAGMNALWNLKQPSPGLKAKGSYPI